MRKKKLIYNIALLLVVTFLSVGYAAFNKDLILNNITGLVRLKADIRITGISVVANVTSGMSTFEDYDVHGISVNISLPNKDSKVIYKIKITNFEAAEMALTAINGLPDNLEYNLSEVDEYVLKDKICDSNNKCNLGITKDIYLTIKYDEEQYIESTTPKNYNLNIDFQFSRFYKITYLNAPLSNQYQKEILEIDTLKLSYPDKYDIDYVSMGEKLVENAEYENVDNNLSLSQISNDVIVKFNINLVQYINNHLYNASSKIDVKNNEETYKYATAVQLMDDRLGAALSTSEGGNIRYYGSQPKNYIYFNCDDYNNQSSQTCELWRIIGIFDGKVKIVRSSPIGSYSWDSSPSNDNGGKGYNKYADADIMKLLNDGYSELSIGGSLYWNQKKGNCYNGIGNSYIECDFQSTGLKSNSTKSMISDNTWYLGGWSATGSTNIYANNAYTQERSNDVYTGNKPTWSGKIALVYPSDYAYSVDFRNCSVAINQYNNCTNYSWFNSRPFWTLSQNGMYKHVVRAIYESGTISNSTNAYLKQNILPTLYLNEEVMMVTGSGTQQQPYQIIIK